MDLNHEYEHEHDEDHDHNHDHEADHDHDDHTRMYEIMTALVNDVKSGKVKLNLVQCEGCRNLSLCAIPYADTLEKGFKESGMPCTIECVEENGRKIIKMGYEDQIFMQIDPVRKEAIQKCYDDMCNVVLYHRVFDVALDTGELEKLRKLLDHWIEHNESHNKTYHDWADKATDLGKPEIAEKIHAALKMTREITKYFVEAKSLL